MEPVGGKVVSQVQAMSTPVPGEMSMSQYVHHSCEISQLNRQVNMPQSCEIAQQPAQSSSECATSYR